MTWPENAEPEPPGGWMGEKTLFGPRGVLHAEPFPHYVGDGCACPPKETPDA